VTPEELARELYIAECRVIHPGSTMHEASVGWEVRHEGQRARYIAMAREAIARAGGGQEAGDTPAVCCDISGQLKAECSERDALLAEILHEAAEYMPEPLVAEFRARAGLGDGHG
jgi:hypothetical protein